MSSEFDLGTISKALNDLKAEVASLRTSLHSAEERIARVEQATFTPSPASPSSPRTTEQDVGDISSTAVSHEGDSFCESRSFSDCSAEIQRQLKPVNNTLSGMTDQLSRIEHVINILAPKPTSPTARLSISAPEVCHCIPEEEPVFAQNKKPFESLLQEQTPCTTKNSKLRYSLAPSPESARHIFGRPSTPSRRVVSLEVAGSPFGNYSDERSPFTQLAPRSVGPSSVFDTIAPRPWKRFHGLSSNSTIGFGASTKTRNG